MKWKEITRKDFDNMNLEDKDKDTVYLICDIKERDFKEFARWVADEIIDEELWELNYGAFAEIACRKLEKLGIVKSNNGYWEINK